jgi:predicted RNase H-like nuclease (RuvC/YqgF family)
MQNRLETLTEELAKKEAEIEQLKKTFIEILTNYGSRYRLIHISETAECRGDEPMGTICRNLQTVEEAVARKTLGVPLRQVTKLEIGEFYVVDLDALRELVNQIRQKLDEKKEIDLRKIVEQYRRGLA